MEAQIMLRTSGRIPHYSTAQTEEYWKCTRKKPYRTRKIALMATHRTNSPDVVAYKCPFCKEWHIGSKPKKG